MPEPMGAYHMIGKDEFEPQRSTNFWLYIYGLESLGDAGNATEDITLCVNSVGGISYNVGDIDVHYGNSTVKFAGLPSYENINLTFNDFIGKNTQKILSKWFALVYNPNTEVVGMASNYKKRGLIVESAPDGSRIRSWDLYGAYPKDFAVDDHEYGNDSNVKIKMTLRVDYVKPANWDL